MEMTTGILKLFATALALVGPAPADSPKEFQLKSGQQIVAIGDSITAEGGARDTGFLRVIDAALAKQYPNARSGPRLDLPQGWEPHWTYTDLSRPRR